MTVWTQLGRKNLEARVWCKACGRSYLVTGRDDDAFWNKIPPTIYPACDRCSQPIKIKITRSGVEVIL